MPDIYAPTWNPQVALGAGQNQPQPFNPLAAAGQVQEIASRRLAIQQQQADLRSKIAIGSAYQQSIDPATGQLDQAKFRTLFSQDSAAAYGAQQAGSESLAQQGKQTSNATDQTQLSAIQFAHLTALASTLVNKPGLSKADVANALEQGGTYGLGAPQLASSIVAQLPDDPAALKQTLHSFIVNNSGNQYADAYGSPAQIDNGGAIISGTTASPASGGGFTPSTETALGISPDTAASQAPGVDNYGAATATPLGMRLQQQGAGGLVNPSPTQPVGTLPPGANNYPWNKGGGYPQPATPTAPAQPGAAAPGGSTPAVQVGLAPGDAEAMGAQKVASANAATSLVNSAADSPNRKATLDNMLSDLTQFSSGANLPGLGRKIATEINGTFGTTLDGDGIQAAQSFDKFSNQIAAAQSGALGVSSDAKLSNAMHANPNSSLTTPTNVQMLHTLMGNEDAINAKANAWQGAGLPVGQYQKWSQQFNQTFDPRVFQMLRMNPEERANMQGEMKKAGTLDAFKTSTAAMAAQGLIPPQTAPAPSAPELPVTPGGI